MKGIVGFIITSSLIIGLGPMIGCQPGVESQPADTKLAEAKAAEAGAGEKRAEEVKAAEKLAAEKLLIAKLTESYSTDTKPPAVLPKPKTVEPISPELARDIKMLVDGNNQFAIDLYKQFADKNDANLFFSPYSISSALAMTYAGARGVTATQIARVLGISGLGERVHPAHARLLGDLQTEGIENGPKTRIANSLWGNKGMAFHDDFLQTTKRHYQAKVSELDFASDPKQAMKVINQWVDRETFGKIPSLLSSNNVSKDTQLVLANAIYFKGIWEFPFDPKQTNDDTFQVAHDQSQPVKMMNLNFTGSFYSGEGVKVLWMPYQSYDRHFLVVVPDEMTGLAKFEKKLSVRLFEKWKLGSSGGHISLQLPRIAFRYKRELSSDLSKMGMRLPFTNEANFVGISPVKTYLNGVVHEAVIDLDEKGTVAAAATATSSTKAISKRMPLPNITIRADHPFCYMIVDAKNDMILFMGRMSDAR